MDEVEEIKHRIDIVEFISTYLTLKKAGANYRAVCPFHQEKTPSFMVSAEKQIFKCFGCGEGGDIFTFVQKMENLEFPEALRLLADRAGIQLKRREFKPEEGKDRKTKLYKINNLAALVFNKILTSHPAGKNALEYLKKRKITLQTIKDFQIGYAASKITMEKFLLQKGFTSSEIQTAGDPQRFYKRIMFPIKDPMGNVVAFTGRATMEGQEPKYLNTSDTIIFHKGRILYNLNQARGPIKQENATIVVEGQMDVIASFQAGVKNVVATSGTALTDEHLKILYRYTPNIIFCFDSDTAGLKTAKKAFEEAIKEGFNVKMVDLGKYKDPGEMIADDEKLWQKAVENALPVIDWYFTIAFGTQHTANGEEKILTSQQKKEIAKEILPVIKIIPDKIEQAHFVNMLAKKLEINEGVVFEALIKMDAPKKEIPKVVSKNKLSNEELLIALLLYRPKNYEKVKKRISDKDFKSEILKKIFLAFKDIEISEKDILSKIKSKLTRDEYILAENLIFQAEKLHQDNPNVFDDDLNQALNHIKSSNKEDLKNYYANEIRKAESERDIQKLKKLIQEFQEAISKKD